jgi:tRNA pseudouridine55 synthase
LKINGVRAYRMARNNSSFSLPSRRISIRSLHMNAFDPAAGTAAFTVVCSGGTYIRSLAGDIARESGTIGYARSIRRTAMGVFSVEDSVALDAGPEQMLRRILPAEKVLPGPASVHATSTQLEAISHGGDIVLGDPESAHPLVYVFNDNHDLVAVTRRISSNVFHPVRVFSAV